MLNISEEENDSIFKVQLSSGGQGNWEKISNWKLEKNNKSFEKNKREKKTTEIERHVNGRSNGKKMELTVTYYL